MNVVRRGCTLLALVVLPAIAGAAARVPFEVRDHRIVIPVRTENGHVLELTLDTGLTFDGVFLYHREAADSLDLPRIVEVLVPGAGDEEPSRAVMADSVTLYVADTALSGQKLVISQADRTQGFPNDGIIGYSLLSRGALEIDYEAREVVLHNSADLTPDASWQAVPITLQKDIPFLDAFVDVEGQGETPIRVYIDLAAGDALLLLTGPDKRFAAPAGLEDRYLGTGLSGDIHGQIGKVAHLRIGTFVLDDVSTAYAPAAVRSKQAGADGILGNGLLDRFHVIFDYQGGRIFLKPNRSFPPDR